MSTVREIYEALFAFAPAYMKEDWDNVGLLCGRWDAEVTKIVVALDPSLAAIEEAKAVGAQLLVTHHPLIFTPVKAVNEDTDVGQKLLLLAENHIAAINLHTNLDCAPKGVNDILAETLGLCDVSVFEPAGKDETGRDYGLLRMGTVKEQNLSEFIPFVKAALGCEGLRFADGALAVRRVAVGGGACASEMEKVKRAGCDTFVTADVKYHEFLWAQEMGLNLIDAGHFETENPVCAVLERVLRESFPHIAILRAKTHKDRTQFA